jgi:hypothetical protein
MKSLLLSLNRTTFVSRSWHARWIAVYSVAVKSFLTTRVKSFHDLGMPWITRVKSFPTPFLFVFTT